MKSLQKREQQKNARCFRLTDNGRIKQIPIEWRGYIIGYPADDAEVKEWIKQNFKKIYGKIGMNNRISKLVGGFFLIIRMNEVSSVRTGFSISGQIGVYLWLLAISSSDQICVQQPKVRARNLADILTLSLSLLQSRLSEGGKTEL